MRPRLLPLLLLLSLLSPSLSRLSPPRSSGKPSGKRPASLPSCLELRAGSSDYRYFIAGGACAAFSHGITTPIDVVKTRMQSDPHKYSPSLLKSTLQLVGEEGPLYLLAGLGPTVVGYGMEGAMKFGVYEALKPLTKTVIDSQAAAFLVASVIAGAVASVILCPMESTRIRLVTDPSFASGLLTGLPKLVSESGFAATFDGLAAMLAKQVPYTLAKQVSFDVVAAALYARVAARGGDPAAMKWAISFAAAAAAAVLACVFSQPGDMVLTQTYKQKGSGLSAMAVVRDIYWRGGVGGFFVGTGARLVHVVSIITSQLMVYDVVKQALGLPATGSH